MVSLAHRLGLRREVARCERGEGVEGGLCARERTCDLLPMAMVRLIMRLGAKLTTSTASATGYMTCNSKYDLYQCHGIMQSCSTHWGLRTCSTG